ncbi:MAG TPA: response regulator [Deltaproteobacteria bacterium]|nr:response regulator [Deltaproteobacteria bacterium]
MSRILIVDDEKPVLRVLRRLLEEEGYRCSVASSVHQAKNLLAKNNFELLLTDIIMPDESGIDLLRHPARNYPDVGLIVVSIVGDESVMQDALDVGLYGYIVKPFEPNQVRVCVENAFRRRKLEIDNRRYRSNLEKQVEERTAALQANLAKLTETEAKLRKTNQEIESIISAISSVLIGLNSDDKIIHWNKVAEETFGLEEDSVMGKVLSDCDISWEWEEIKKAIHKCRETRETLRLDDVAYQRMDGKKGLLGISLNPIFTDNNGNPGILFLAADITERRILEEQLAQAQKLEAIGQLAAGIAHEINTPTQYVGDNLRFLGDAFSDILELMKKYEELLQRVKKDNSVSEKINEIEELADELDFQTLIEEIPKAIEEGLEGISRVTEIVRATKEFSHPNMKEKVPIDINHALENTITVARNEWKYVAEIETDFDTDLPLVPCIPGEINQAIINLIVNAVHSISDIVGEGSGGKGKITIRTSKVGQWCEIVIRDTGCGIPEELRDRIFEPFFTTKEVGRGTGQGLAIVHRVIVEKHGGRIHFESEVGKGTSFFIKIPLEVN